MKAEKARKSSDGETPTDADGQSSRNAGLSTALVNDLTAHRTAAVRALLADCPAVALAAVVHALAVPVFYEACGSGSNLALRLDVPCLRAEGIDDSPAMKRTAQQHAAWREKLPEDESALWDFLRTQDSGTLTGLLAYCVACVVKPERSTAADRLASAVSLDMAQWWQPTVAGFLGRVAKPQILEAVTEGKGRDAADKIANFKKGDMAERAVELLTGTGWLPAMLKAA
jgi:ParB family transcriptional regulator, chromosome partitioning protein